MRDNLDLFKVTEVELIYRNKRSSRDRPVVTSPHLAHRYLPE
jgi:hypothetical protein